LALRAALIANAHQSSILFSGRKGGRTESVKRLAKIAKLARSLATELDALNPLFHLSMWSRIPENVRTGVPSPTSLRHLAEASGGASNALRSRGSGRPDDVFTRQTIRLLTGVVEEATGKSVTASKGKAGIDTARLTGPGGEFIRACLKLVDPSITDSALVRYMREERQRFKDPKVVAEDKNVVETMELLRLNPRVMPF
jgi:hypothetical protein